MQKILSNHRRTLPSRRVIGCTLLGLALTSSSLLAQSSTDVSGQVEEFVGFGGEDPTLVRPNTPLDGALGFSKSLVETPRSVTVVNSDLIDKVGIRDGDQLFRIVPGTYTVNRWGIAGATNVRGNNAYVYLRGMKRIDPQGNIRNVITMWDNVEIFRGPPSPIFGNGRIGGYVNYVPKSVRGTTGKYLTKPQDSITAIAGLWDRVEFQVNYAQPLDIGDRPTGYQVFLQTNDSDSYFRHNYQRDRVLQTSFSMNLSDKWRFETGLIYQEAVNAGQVGANRATQATLDDGIYPRFRSREFGPRCQRHGIRVRNSIQSELRQWRLLHRSSPPLYVDLPDSGQPLRSDLWRTAVHEGSSAPAGIRRRRRFASRSGHS
ncbi:MAG: TonB-dependent receptor [Candidatus Synoicihabitans palmerolidicus]|nr:TonB-dependent receptor [Candidatus Synoicihabitans palmerolidicus]